MMKFWLARQVNSVSNQHTHADAEILSCEVIQNTRYKNHLYTWYNELLKDDLHIQNKN